MEGGTSIHGFMAVVEISEMAMAAMDGAAVYQIHLLILLVGLPQNL